MLGFFGLLASLGNLAALNLGLATPDTHAGSSVAGRVRIEGQMPQSNRISMSADPSCAKLHPAPAVGQDYVAGSDNSLGNVIVFISDGLQNRTFDVPTQEVTFEQKGCIYEPHVVAVRANQKLKMVNSDNTTHNIHPLPANNREWNESQAPKAAPLEKSFAREEILLPVKCNQHPWMKMYVNVVKTPFFAVTGADGKYEIKGLPPGDYTLAFVQEKLGEQTQKVTLAAKDSKTVDQGFKP